MIVRFDADLRHIYCNPAVEDQLGVPAHAFIGKTPLETGGPRAQAEFVELSLRTALETGEEQEVEQSFPLPSGAKHFLTRIVPERDEQGRIRSLLAITRDITERKQAEDALKESEERFRQFFESLPQLVWTCRLDGTCDFLSPQWVRYTGLPEGAQLGYGWLEQLHPDDREPTLAVWKIAYDSGSDFNIKFRIRRHDGIYHWFYTRAVLLHDLDGRPTKWFGSNTDIDDFAQAEDALRESENQFRSYVETAPIGVFVCDERGRYVLVNPAATTITGYSSEELLAMSIPDLLPLESQVLAAGFFQVVSLTGRTSAEFAFRRKNGDIGTWFLEGVRLSPTRFMGLVTDITESKQAEEALRESEEQYHLLFESASDALFLSATDTGLIVEANTVASELYGYDREELLTKKSTDLSAEPEETQRRTHEAQTTPDQVINIPLRLHRKKDGTVFPVEITARSLSVKGRRLLLVAARDITERRRAEEKLQESEQRYRLLIETANEGILVAQGASLKFVNPIALELTGYTEEELLSLPFLGSFSFQVGKPTLV
jgi:PAS domain S-box-containing protein